MVLVANPRNEYKMMEILPVSSMSTLQRLSCRAWLVATGLLSPMAALAQGDFGGEIPDIPGTPVGYSDPDIRQVILNALVFVLNFLALAAVIFIVIAGIRLIVSQGSDEQKDKAKKTIIAVIVGLLVVLFARVIVGFFTQTVPDAFGA